MLVTTGQKVSGEYSYHVSGGGVFGHPREALDEEEELVEGGALGHCGAEALVELIQVLLGGEGQVGGGAEPVTCGEYSCAQQEVPEQVWQGEEEEVVEEGIF